MTDPGEALAAASTAIYQPFPAFVEWAALTADSAGLERAEQTLTELRQTTPTEVLTEAVNTATRSAAVDTGAIEGLYQVDRGFTRTIATEAANWEIVLGAREEETQRAIEDALAAYDFVLDAATGSRGPITEVWIKQLHATICASQATHRVWTAAGWQDQALPKGEYKTQPNSPINLTTGRVHAYASVFDTPPEMQRLIGELNTSEFLAAHPVLQAAYAHYAFVCVHPFTDGNGRVSRALASVYLYRSPGIPLVIFADQKPAYLDALELADAGDPQSFVNFIGARATDAVLMVGTELTRISAQRRRGQLIGEFARAMRSESVGLPHVDVDDAGRRALATLSTALATVSGSLELPQGVQLQVGTTGGAPRALNGYRAINGNYPVLMAQNSVPVQVHVQRGYYSYVVRNEDAPDTFALFSDDFSSSLEFQVADLIPAVSLAAQWRIEAWAEAEITRILEQLYAQVDIQLRQSGYR